MIVLENELRLSLQKKAVKGKSRSTIPKLVHMPEKEKCEPEEGKRRRGNEKPEPDMGHHCRGRWAAQSLGSKNEADT